MTPRLACALLVAASAPALAADKPGCKDHPLLPTRMPDYDLVDCVERDFDALEFLTRKPPRLRKEGRTFVLTYRVTDRKLERGGVEVVRNYENAIRKVGGAIAGSDPARWVNGAVVVDGREVFVQAEKGNGLVWVRVVEARAMDQHIVADAAAWGRDLKATGHAAVYGIHFDTGRSELKPESKPALEEVAKLLAAEPALRLWVVGHTDSVGGAEGNLQLSRDRAEAVVKALATAHGVAAARLKAYGVGPLAPVATNQTDEGRAKNRRVELVAQ